MNPRRLKALLKDLDNAQDYGSWREIALEFDRESGLEEWKLHQTSDLYDHHLIRMRLNKLKELRKKSEHVELFYTLNEGIHGNLGGMGRAALYNHAKFGTKKLIVEYIDEVVASLVHISQVSNKIITLDKKLDFFNRASHCFGRSALMLSGGANFGMFHVGVTKALHEQKLLPTVISGSSAGAVVAAVIGTHSDEELKEYFKLEMIKHEAMKFMGWKKLFKGEALLDGNHLEETMAKFLPELTFEEAFEKTGRAINITISPARLNHESRMLNATSSPNVFVRKGVMASTAVPGLFPPVTLVAKNYHGEAQPYNPSRQWVDGTLSNDLPSKRLSRLYGVNHFIASQVNPHVLPFVSEKGQSKSISQMTVDIAAKTTKNVVSNILKHGTDNLRSPAVGYFLTQVHAMVAQDYSADITITPDFKSLNPWKIFSNPQTEDIYKLVRAGEVSTWPKIEWIRYCTKISKTLDSIIESLTQEEIRLIKKVAQKNG
jgi:TAG lipase / steryl ester hydrolase / phospholipase A2 / LPA acyltransferase